MTPSDSSRWMRFQHGVDDRPTREPISATDSAAFSCRTARIFRSMASIMAIIFQIFETKPLYIEDYSKSSGEAIPAKTGSRQLDSRFPGNEREWLSAPPKTPRLPPGS